MGTIREGWRRFVTAAIGFVLVVLLGSGCTAVREFVGLGVARPVPAYVWWEAETAKKANFNGWLRAKDLPHRTELSGDEWLSHFMEETQTGVRAEWTVVIPEAGNYHLFARKLWYHGPFRWQFDDGEWHDAARVGLLDHVQLSDDFSANWVGLNEVAFDAPGEHEFRVELLPEAEKYVGHDGWADRGRATSAAFDCFLLTKGPFMPRGELKPGEIERRAQADHWAFAPAADPFGTSEIDLSRLNRQSAGKFGAVVKDGEGFGLDYDGDGQADRPIRFWGVCVGANALYLDRGSVDYLARRLAKAGVNLVRVHAPVMDWNQDDPEAVDKQYLDRLHYFVHAMKQQGIYTALSIYSPDWFTVGTLKLPGSTNPNVPPWCQVFLSPRMQEIYKSWAEEVLTTPNPYEGNVPLGKDPALAIWEMVNDDNLFSWQFKPGDVIPQDLIAPLEKRFAQWAAKKHGSVEAALKAWGQDPQSDRVTMLDSWFLTEEGIKATTPERAADQTAFTAALMHEFYESMNAWIHQVCGSPLTYGANTYRNPYGGPWDPWERYGDTACPVMDRHCYWGGTEREDGENFYAVSKNDKWADRCGPLEPESMTVREIQYEGHAHMVSEYSFPMINMHRAEGVFLEAVYGAVQGTDAICCLSVDSPAWERTLTKWPVMTPAVIGQFPALALAYRRGDVAEEEVFILQEIPLGYDQAVPDPDPMAYYIGRVVRRFVEGEANFPQPNLAPYLDEQHKRVRTKKGQVWLDYGKGVCWVNTPRCQGATGNLKKLSADALSDVGIEAGNECGCVVVVSLEDNAPISKAGRLLVQVMSDETNYGWKERAPKDPESSGKKTVVEIGTGPVNVRNIAGQVILRRPDASGLEVRALDPNGYELDRKVRVERRGEELAISLQPDVLYYLVRKRPPAAAR